MEDPVGTHYEMSRSWIRCVLQGEMGRPVLKDNRLGKNTPITTLLARDVAFCGRVRDDVLACDFDQPEAPSTSATLIRHAVAAGYPHIGWCSGGPDRRHVFIWTPDPESWNQLSLLAKQLGADVRSEHNLIRPPGSLHRKGHQIQPVSHEAYCRNRELILKHHASPSWTRASGDVCNSEHKRPSQGPSLAPRPARTISTPPMALQGDGGARRGHRDQPEQLPSRSPLGPVGARYINDGVEGSDQAFALAMSVAASGAPVQELLDILHTLDARGKLHFNNPRHSLQLDNWITEQVWPKAIKKVKESKENLRCTSQELVEADLTPQALAHADWGYTYGWPGRSGPNDQAIWSSLLGVAIRRGVLQDDGSIHLEISAAAVGAGCGMARSGAQKALQRLVDLGKISLYNPGGARQDIDLTTGELSWTGRSNTWCIEPPGADVSVSTSTPVLLAWLNRPWGHDAFVHRGLGKRGLSLWTLLQDADTTGLSYAELGRRTGAHPTTVKRILSKLASARLAVQRVRDNEMRRRIASIRRATLERLATRLNVQGTVAKRWREAARSIQHMPERMQHARDVHLLQVWGPAPAPNPLS